MNKAHEIVSYRAPAHIRECFANQEAWDRNYRGKATFYRMSDGSSVEVNGNRLRAHTPMLRPVIESPRQKRAARFIQSDNPMLGELSDDFADFLYDAQREFERKYMEPTKPHGVDHRLFCAM